MSATLITGLGLVGTSYAQHALKRGETVVFYDIAPRKDFLAHKLGSANVTVVQRVVRVLPSLIERCQWPRTKAASLPKGSIFKSENSSRPISFPWD